MSKKHKDLYGKIADMENIYDAYKKTLKAGMRYKVASIKYSENETYNLRKLKSKIDNRTYSPGNYTEFYVYEPKKRLIYAPSYEDKIVQHMVNNILKGIYQPCFIKDSYACLENKGTHKALNRIHHFLKKAKWMYGDDAYIIKMDIKKFFYSIDREKLKSIIRKKISCSPTLDLLNKIIDSSPGKVGLPLGNLTSQLFANVYLNEMDNYCKRVLRLKHYVRYADDAVAVVESKEQARNVLKDIDGFIKAHLHLELHPEKTKVFPVQQGVNTVGFKIWPTHRLLRNDCKKKVKRKIKAMPRLIRDGKMKKEKAEQMLNSWVGHSMHGNSFNFILSLLCKNEYLSFINNKFKLQEI